MNNNEALETQTQNRIRELYDQAVAGVEATKKEARKSMLAAIECGRLLNSEKDRIDENHGRGHWIAYRESHYSFIPERTAQHWMRLAKSVVSIEDTPDNNLLRQGLLALGVFPPKEYPPEDPANINVRGFVARSHLSVVNKWQAWLRPIEKRAITTEERQRLRQDFKPLYEWLRSIYG